MAGLSRGTDSVLDGGDGRLGIRAENEDNLDNSDQADHDRP